MAGARPARSSDLSRQARWAGWGEGLFVGSKAVDLDFDQPFRIDESRNADESAGRANVAKKLAMRARRLAPAVDVDQHCAGSNRIFEPPARVLDRPQAIARHTFVCAQTSPG